MKHLNMVTSVSQTPLVQNGTEFNTTFHKSIDLDKNVFKNSEINPESKLEANYQNSGGQSIIKIVKAMQQ